MDEHIIPLKQTLKEQQKQIDEQKEMISKQAHLMIIPRTSGLVSASITCTVIGFFCTGVFLVLTDALRPFSPTDVLRYLVCRVCVFEVAGRSSGL
jgi:hypothetical protein